MGITELYLLAYCHYTFRYIAMVTDNVKIFYDRRMHDMCPLAILNMRHLHIVYVTFILLFIKQTCNNLVMDICNVQRLSSI
jgi:hypothetical protein